VFALPRISNFGGMTIVVYYNDHNPPHFHIIYNEVRCRILIESGKYMSGHQKLPKTKEKEALKWLELHRNDIMRAWNDCRANRVPSKIPPLY